jgi:peptidyl-dipeptidase Dcp
MSDTSKNPFNSPWSDNSKIPFDQIKPEDFMPALDAGLSLARKNIEAIRSQSEAPTFENTILALETASEQSDYVAEVYFNMLSAEADEAMHALAKEISPKVTAFGNDVMLDIKLFNRVRHLHDQKDKLNLSGEQMKLLEKSFRSFRRNGALLGEEQKNKLRLIDEELSKLGPQFSENLLKATYSFELHLTQESDWVGLPDSVIEAAKMSAKEKGKSGALFTLEAPSYLPFMTYSERRDLREKMYKAFASRSFGGDFDNRDLAKRTAVLRHERAQLLGFKTHADYVLEERMAETSLKVEQFLARILKSARPAASREIAELAAFAKGRDGLTSLAAWDLTFYIEKLKQQKFKIDDEILRPYFRLENVVAGVFEHARRLYNLEFKALTDVPVYHPDVRVFEVVDAKTKANVGLFYADFFPRKTKKGGAWMTPLREQGLFHGKVRRPHIGIVCNFTKPTDTRPSLLSLEEVRTLFHEFGHALHGLLSRCTYRSIAGTNVYWDFVELPSQIMENWTLEKEALDLFAAHYETGEKIPTEMTQKIKESSRFMAGLANIRQMTYATLDMAWHNHDPHSVNDIEVFEESVTKDARVMDRVPGTCISTTFAHIFSGGYSAGYYSYKWAEVLDADAFELFREQGLFNTTVADAFRLNILERGGTEHPMELYKKFRGREPDPDALLRRDGLM